MFFNSLGRYEDALVAAERAAQHPWDLGLSTWVTPELVEAAVRSGHPERAAGGPRVRGKVPAAARWTGGPRMPNYEAESQEAVASALQRLRFEEPVTFTDKVNGVTIKGWEFRDYYRKDGPYYDGPWEESSDVFRILDEPGSIWERQDYSRELHQPPWTYERRNILVRCGASTLVGAEGKPFSQWLAKGRASRILNAGAG